MFYVCNRMLVPGQAEHPGMGLMEAETGSESLFCTRRMKLGIANTFECFSEIYLATKTCSLEEQSFENQHENRLLILLFLK